MWSLFGSVRHAVHRAEDERGHLCEEARHDDRADGGAVVLEPADAEAQTYVEFYSELGNKIRAAGSAGQV